MSQTKTCRFCSITDRIEKFVLDGSVYRPVCKQCDVLQRLNSRLPKQDKKPQKVNFVGDGPCWVCRNQAIGETPYRLCVICAG